MIRSLGLASGNWLSRLAEAVASPGDSPDRQLQKALMVRASLPILLAGLLWGRLCLIVGRHSQHCQPDGVPR